MRVSDDVALSWQFKSWAPKRSDNYFRIGRDGFQDIADEQTLTALQKELSTRFPRKISGRLAQVEVAADVYEDLKHLTGYALPGTGRHWVLLPSGAVNRLRWTALMALTDDETIRLLKLSEFPSSFTPLVGEVVVWFGLELLVAHELGHIFHGHSNESRSEGVLLQARELEADNYAANHIARVLATKQSLLQGLPSEVWKFPEHYLLMFMTLSMFSVFAFWSIEGQLETTDSYPPPNARIWSLISGLEVAYSHDGSYPQKTDLLMASSGLSSKAMKALLKKYPERISEEVSKSFDLFEGSQRAIQAIETAGRSAQRLVDTLHASRRSRQPRNPWDAV